jgi:capsid portal protein
MRKVFIAYVVVKPSMTFVDRAILELENSILSEEDLDNIEEQLKMMYNDENDNRMFITILNWKELA